jgi:rhamnose utilization protein RhaD (predicted bifunctional aldolase and dehydrogenase)
MTAAAPADFDAFLQLSARIGSNRLLTQGAGGNTSIKSDGFTWVKASGTWLSEALERSIMVPVRTSSLLEALRTDPRSIENPTEHVDQGANPAGLRPSIETAFHCLLPQRVVAHFHGIDALAHLVCADRHASLSAAMARVPGLRWQLFDYFRPGAPLAAEIDDHLRPGTEVLFLANHGVIIAGASVDAVARILDQLSDVLIRPARALEPADPGRLAAIGDQTGYLPSENPLHNSLGTDAVTSTLARVGVLMPDQAIFLGPSFSLDPAKVSQRPAVLIVEGAGVLLRSDLSKGAVEMVGCVAELLRRLPGHAPLVPLPAEEVDQLLNWEAEIYRQSLDRKLST